MPRSLSYADAARLLGGRDSGIVAALETTAGWLMLGTAPGVSEVLGWFDAKAELARLTRQLVSGLSERRGGLSRYSRTERVEAAHTVIVVAAFFESLAEVSVPAALTRSEQIALGTGGPAVPTGFVTQIMSAGSLLPSPAQPLTEFRDDLEVFYGELAEKLIKFLDGLAAVEHLPEPERARLADEVRAAVQRSAARYDDSLAQLSTEFPEVAYWADRRERRAVHATLAELGTLLEAIHTGRAPDDRRARLAASYLDDLRRPVVDTGDVPDGIAVPSLGEAYLPHRFRAPHGPVDAFVSDEDWWSASRVRDDLRDFLAGHLTSPRATRAPLLVLGQPGSGKSVLTRVLAASLPATEFLPIRVALRDAPSLDQIQDQVEHAIHTATGERVDWPALVRSAGDALPVLLLDGFDELLQATGVSQTDYLDRVAAFQRREGAQGRPVAVIVTSRIAVANRARAPEGTLAVRLEPFDEQQISAWLDVWNRSNAVNFAARGLAPLNAGSVLAHAHLAEQPLLLLMLALYDADGNALQRVGAGLRTDQLYERLLHSFAGREVRKQRPWLDQHDLRAAVEDELRQLAVVGFAMFNRSSLWVTESDLERDLNALFGPARQAPAGLRSALRPAELMLGRFFFVHRARSMLGEPRLQTYEFLHATFTEFFVARLTWRVLLDVAAQASASTASFGPAPVHDDLLRALLSHQPLSRRSTVIDFLTDMAAAAPGVRAGLRELLIRLFQAVRHHTPPQHYAAYLPSDRGEPARQAAYSANLLLLIVCVAGEVRANELFPGRTDRLLPGWSRQASLWRSQLTAGSWDSLIELLAVDRLWTEDQRDLRISLNRGDWSPAPAQLSWTFGRMSPPPEPSSGPGPAPSFWEHTGDYLNAAERLRTANFLCEPIGDMTQHIVEAFASAPELEINRFAGFPDDALRSPVRVMLDLWVDPSPTTYQRCADIATCAAPTWAREVQLRCAETVLDRLVTHPGIRPAEVADLLERLAESLPPFLIGQLTSRFVRCALTYLGQGRDPSRRLALLLDAVLMPDLGGADPVSAADALVRLHELNLPVPPLFELRSRERFDALVLRVAGQRPDLVHRLAPLAPASE